MTDGEIVQAVLGGDRESYRSLVERHQKMVYAIAWSRLGDADLCEEAAQEAFIKAFRYLRALRDPEKFGAWLACIARNVAVSVLRHYLREIKGRRRWHFPDSELIPSVQEEGDGPSTQETLHQALTVLPDSYRECLVIYYIEGKDIRETAAALGISEAAMKTRLHRARHALRDSLEQRLGAGLALLRPKNDFSTALMPLLPPMPLGMMAGGASLFTKISGVVTVFQASLSLLFYLWLPAMMFLGVLTVGLTAIQAGNLRPGPGASVRTKLLWRHAGIAVGIIAMGLLFGISLFALSPSFLGLFYLLFLVLALLQVKGLLQLTRNPFILGQLLFVILLCVSAVAVWFFNAPVYLIWFAFLFNAFVGIFTAAYIPHRHDYNLFLRYEFGLLGDPQDPDFPGKIPSMQDLNAFVRFLASHHLVAGFGHSTPHESVVFLQPLKISILPMRKTMFSRLVFYADGRCEAWISNRDWYALQQLAEKPVTQRVALQEGVARRIDRALQAFLAGDSIAANRIVAGESDDSIYRHPRMLPWIFRGLNFLVLLLFAWIFFFTSFLAPQTHIVSIKKLTTPISRVYGAIIGITPDQHAEVVLLPHSAYPHRYYLWDYTPELLQETKSYAVAIADARAGNFSFEDVPPGDYFVEMLPATPADIPAFKTFRNNTQQVHVTCGVAVNVAIHPMDRNQL